MNVMKTTGALLAAAFCLTVLACSHIDKGKSKAKSDAWSQFDKNKKGAMKKLKKKKAEAAAKARAKQNSLKNKLSH